MLLPTTTATILLVALAAALCVAFWIATRKLAGNYRFEPFSIDASLGAVLGALILALTFGSMGSDLTFEDNLVIAGKRNMAIAAAGGVLLNLGCFLLAAAIAVAGAGVTVPLALGVAGALNLILHFAGGGPANSIFLFASAGLLLAGVGSFALANLEAHKGKRTSGAKGLGLSIGAGVFIAAFYPVVLQATSSEIGLGAYTAAVFGAIGMGIATPVLALFFGNLPVSGEPAGLTRFFRARAKDHGIGILAGMFLAAALTATLAALMASRGLRFSEPFILASFPAGGVLVAALGLFAWKEQTGAPGKTRAFALCGTSLQLLGVLVAYTA